MSAVRSLSELLSELRIEIQEHNVVNSGELIIHDIFYLPWQVLQVILCHAVGRISALMIPGNYLRHADLLRRSPLQFA